MYVYHTMSPNTDPIPKLWSLQSFGHRASPLLISSFHIIDNVVFFHLYSLIFVLQKLCLEWSSSLLLAFRLHDM